MIHASLSEFQPVVKKVNRSSSRLLSLKPHKATSTIPHVFAVAGDRFRNRDNSDFSYRYKTWFATELTSVCQG